MKFKSLLILACLCGLSIVTSADAADWRAGTARARITPPMPMPMAGYAGRGMKHADGALTDLWAKVLVLEDAQGHQAALITLDLVGIDRTLSLKICDEIQSEQHWDRSQIAICCSHTHTGPVVDGNLRPMQQFLFDAENQNLVKEYAVFLRAAIVGAVAEAVSELKPAEVKWGSGQATFAVNRRTNKEDDVVSLRMEGKLQGPSDHDVPVLVVRKEGKIEAIVFGYACHNTVLSIMQWSGDYAGFAQLSLEETYPGCQAMFWAGCGGDQNPLPRRTIDLAKSYGAELANAVQRVVDVEMESVSPILKTHYKEVDLPLAALPTNERLEEDAKSTNQYVAACAKMLLEQIGSGHPLHPSYPYPVEVWKLGNEVSFVFLGGEVVVDYAIRLKENSGIAAVPTSIWCASYSNDVMAYIPSRRVLLEGGYEAGGAMVYYGQPSIWAPEVEEIIVKSTLDLATQ
ncbi:neutral/alkaline non-lysosomal ceramidase N-terminal domain-containing protein [Planctomicrobium sp. SH661]|uniref:neutral/alkaline non-lysosomal ceramidase N-terminal domain-containing protein n=1 Tax=Planctomicrobium sp. SH661 TaxID=3448124 RepID=UPI003F5AFA3D